MTSTLFASLSQAAGATAEPSAQAVATESASESPGLLQRVLFVDWPGNVFQRSTWEELMYGFWVALALLGALLLLAEMVAVRAGHPPSKRSVRWVSIGLSLVGFCAYFSFGNPSVRYHDFYHRHEFFHYYLGSKYSEELGYTRLYECTVAAELELGKKKQLERQEMRDLRSENLIRPISESPVFQQPELCTQHFSEERWQAFKADVAWIESTSSGKYWASMKKDHGYNPPPVWTMTGKLLSELAPAGDTSFKLLASIDVVLHLVILGMLAWAFGWKASAIAAVFWGCNGAANFYWTGGGMLRQDWIALFVASMCLAKKRYFGLSGAAFAWAGLLRLFPFAAGLGWLALIALYWLEHRRLHRDHLRFLAGAAIAAGVLLPSAALVAGPGAFKEFAAHITLHNRTSLTNHMGVEPMLVHSWDGRMRFTRDDGQSDPFTDWKAGRAERKQALRPLALTISLLLAGWAVWALRKTKHFWLGLPLSIPFTISLTSITCYYYVMFVVLCVLPRLRPSLGPALLLGAACSQVLLAHYHWIDDRFVAQSYVFVALSLLPLVAFSRPLSVQAVREWLARFAPKSTTSKSTTREDATARLEPDPPARPAAEG